MSLKDLSNDQLFVSFREAFADYEIQLNSDELFRMLKRRGFQSELSFGAFYEDRLISFTFNGIGVFNGQRTAYDTGTGTIPDYQGQGLAGEVFRHTEKELKAAGVEQYLLEVLQHNSTAVRLYKKLGFEISRSFNYFHQEAGGIQINAKQMEASAALRSIPLDSLENNDFGDFHTSWQNSVSAIRRSPEDFRTLGFFDQERMLGSLVMDPQTGDITQIQVDPEHRRKGIGTALIHRALQVNEHKEIKLLNADTRDTGLTKFLEVLNIPLQGKQYEMIKLL